jgi:hypothetical protein
MPKDRFQLFVEKIIKSDKKILEKKDVINREPTEIYKILRERLDLYNTALKIPIPEKYQLFFSNIINDIMVEAAIVATKEEFDVQVSQIISRLDSMENDIKAIKNKLKIS